MVHFAGAPDRTAGQGGEYVVMRRLKFYGCSSSDVRVLVGVRARRRHAAGTSISNQASVAFVIGGRPAPPINPQRSSSVRYWSPT